MVCPPAPTLLLLKHSTKNPVPVKMKQTLLILSATLLNQLCLSQQIDCSKTSMGWKPINDLGKGISPVTGKMGGLYPNGSNYMPASHKADGLSLASQVECLDANGNADPVNGKMVWLSIGLSNTTQESQVFIPMANAFTGKNPKLTLVDGAVGSHSVRSWANPADPKYAAWDTVSLRLANAGVSAKQVQVIWFKHANSSGGVPVQEYYDSLVVQFKRVMNEIKTRFPNVKLCYVSSRIYAGYATGTLNPEPYSYWTGWADKQIIEDQINGDPQLAYSGSSARSPWLAWGPYLWADGTTPRSDGLTWLCPTDFQNDGTHPSPAGEQKVANLLLNFFKTDSTATPWFLGTGCVATSIEESSHLSTTLQVSPNPSNGDLTIGIPHPIQGTATIVLYNSLGQQCYSATADLSSGKKDLHLHDRNFSDGLYFLSVTGGERTYRATINIKQSEY